MKLADPIVNEVRRRLQERREAALEALKAVPPLTLSCLELGQTGAALGEALRKIRENMPEGGLFLGVVVGAGSLQERPSALPPLPDIESLGRAMVAAGFALPVVDREELLLLFPDEAALAQSLGVPPAAQEGSAQATLELLFLHGWKD